MIYPIQWSECAFFPVSNIPTRRREPISRPLRPNPHIQTRPQKFASRPVALRRALSKGAMLLFLTSYHPFSFCHRQPINEKLRHHYSRRQQQQRETTRYTTPPHCSPYESRAHLPSMLPLLHVGCPDDEALHKNHCLRISRCSEWMREEARSEGKDLFVEQKSIPPMSIGQRGGQVYRQFQG
jgi:hypothetical protein